jgi:hypothetical protein
MRQDRNQLITTRWSALWAKGGDGRALVFTVLVAIALALPSAVAIVCSAASWSD